MVLSSDSSHAAHPEQEAVVLAGFACEEDGAGGRRVATAAWAIAQPGHHEAALHNTGCCLQVQVLCASPGVADGLPTRA